MTKISDELRAAGSRLFLRESDGYGTIMSLADRIDDEMAELPRAMDGKPIRVGETVYGKDGRTWHVRGVTIGEMSEASRCVIFVTNELNVRLLFKPECLNHERPDSLERIADEIEKADVDGYTDWADRIRRLAKEREE